jgi:hypothetical protein
VNTLVSVSAVLVTFVRVTGSDTGPGKNFAGIAQNTSNVPVKLTAAPAFELDRIVVRASVGPVVEYVPIPVSQPPPDCSCTQ